MLVVIPEMLNFIYGNIIIYKPAQIACKEAGFNSLWNCCFVLVFYGYFYMLYALGFILFFLGVFLLYKAWSTEASYDQKEEFHTALENIPMLNNIDAQLRLARRESEANALLLSSRYSVDHSRKTGD